MVKTNTIAISNDRSEIEKKKCCFSNRYFLRISGLSLFILTRMDDEIYPGYNFFSSVA